MAAAKKQLKKPGASQTSKVNPDADEDGTDEEEFNDDNDTDNDSSAANKDTTQEEQVREPGPAIVREGVDEQSPTPQEDPEASPAVMNPDTSVHESPNDIVTNYQNDNAGLAPAYERLTGAPKDGRSFQPGEPVILEGIQRGGLLVVLKPVYRAAKAPGSSRWRYHLLMSKGAEISMAKVKEIGERKEKTDLGTFQTDQKNLNI